MATRIHPTLVSGLTTLVVLGAWSITLQAQAPKGWYVAGSKPADYETGIDASGAYNGHPQRVSESKEASSRRLRHAHAGFQRGSLRRKESSLQCVSED